MSEITELLQESSSHDLAVARRAVDLAYKELKAISAFKLIGERPNHTWQPTELLHEVCTSILRSGLPPDTRDRKSLLLYFATAMRNALVSHARHRNSLTAGGEYNRVDPTPEGRLEDVIDLGDGSVIQPDISPEVIAVANAMNELKPALREIVYLKYWMGTTDKEAAVLLGTTASDVQKQWKKARLRLGHLISGTPAPPDHLPAQAG